jgi:hypothetical protein
MMKVYTDSLDPDDNVSFVFELPDGKAAIESSDMRESVRAYLEKVLGMVYARKVYVTFGDEVQ